MQPVPHGLRTAVLNVDIRPAGKRVVAAFGQEWDRLLGAALLMHFFVVAWVKISYGEGAEMLWISHSALLATALGLMTRRWWMPAAALTAIMGLHTLWLCDFGLWLVTGQFPLRICGYLARGDGWTWIGTGHHFYLLPLLACLFLRKREYPASALPATMLGFLYLSAMSRFILPPPTNVNFAFSVTSMTDHPVARLLNTTPPHQYLLTLNLMALLVFFLPAAFVLFGITWLSGRRATRSCHVERGRILRDTQRE